MTTPIDKRDLPWIVLIGASFIFGLVFSWERWGSPLIDCGREMNQPLRLARGEMLYSDVRHIYGPLSPYINAMLYRLFGPALAVLYADGIFTALAIVALIYWLARQLMGRAASTVAALSVVWLCAFKAAGNYMLPYSYSALHGCALGLAALALAVLFVRNAPGRGVHRRRRNAGGDVPLEPSLSASFSLPRRANISRSHLYYLIAAGAVAGVTTLAKTEMGFAAVTAGVVAAGLAGYPDLRRALFWCGLFVAPAVTLVTGTYGLIAARVGWRTLSHDSLLLFQHMPPELVYFNKAISGFDRPLHSLTLMLNATLRLTAFAVAIAVVSFLLARWRTARASAESPADGMAQAGRVSYSQLWLLTALPILLLLAMPVIVSGLPWDQGPYMMMPVLLLVLLIATLIRYRRQVALDGEAERGTLVFIVIAAYALASLARMMLRVRSGGAYGSFLLPASVIIFTYGWTHSFINLFREARARHFARRIVFALLFMSVSAMTIVTAYRYVTKNTYRVGTLRGTMITEPKLGRPFAEAIDFINREIAPGEPIAVMPEGTSLNFLTDRPNPLREEIITPGYLDAEGEERAIRQLAESNTRVILVMNRTTKEFGAPAFGRDYCQRLMSWIEKNFEEAAVFGPDRNSNPQFGDETFFIRAYRKRR